MAIDRASVMRLRNPIAVGLAVAAAVAVGALVLARLVRVATWGGPDGGSGAVTDLPLGLLLLFAVTALGGAAMAGKFVYELVRRCWRDRGLENAESWQPTLRGSAPSEAGARPVWALPHRSQEMESGPCVEIAPGSVTLKYDYETDDGRYGWEQAVFRQVIGLRFTEYESCSEEHVAAYDRLIELPDSEWLEELRRRRPDPTPDVRHLRIFFDEIGCYDIAAGEFALPASETRRAT